MTNRIPYSDALAAQPAALAQVAERVRCRLADPELPLAGDRPVFVGIGASYCAAAVGAYLLQRRGIAAIRATPGQVVPGSPVPGDFVIAISQGGRSAETVQVLTDWESVPSAGVVNVSGTPVLERVHTPIGLGDAVDSYASTVGFTGTVVALSMLAERWNAATVDPLWSDALGQVFGAVDRAQADIAALANALEDAATFDIVGSGISVGIAEEAALLVREAVNVPATGFDTRTYLHGPMESAGGGAHIFFGGDREARAAAALAQRGHRVALMTSEHSRHADELQVAGGHVISFDAASEARRALIEIVLVQYLVLHLAAARLRDIDTFVYSQDDTKIGEQTE